MRSGLAGAHHGLFRGGFSPEHQATANCGRSSAVNSPWNASQLSFSHCRSCEILAGVTPNFFAVALVVSPLAKANAIFLRRLGSSRSQLAKSIRQAAMSAGVARLAYLIGEKFLNFLEAADDDVEFRAELSEFVAEIKTIFEPWQLAEYLEPSCVIFAS
jgi:hypothetical protein